MALSEKEQQQINTLVGRFEANTGIQAVAAVVDKADAYPELPWYVATALGAAHEQKHGPARQREHRQRALTNELADAVVMEKGA